MHVQAGFRVLPKNAFNVPLLGLLTGKGAGEATIGVARTADIGRYGPYVKAGKQSASLENPDEVFEIGVNRAVTVIAERKAKGPARGAGANVIKELGEHPDDQKPIKVLDGRFGPYVKYDKVNATIPKDENPEELTLERGLELIAARIAKGPAKKRKKAAPKKKKSA